MKSFGIMFHHFHDGKKHIRCQGSIDKIEFETLLSYIINGGGYSIINAGDYYNKVLSGKIKGNEICLTFDDALLSQFDVAFPVLKEREIKAFWFIYTSPFHGILEKLEVYHHFRFKCFNHIDEFYNGFFLTLDKFKDEIKINVNKKLDKFNPVDYLKGCDFYSDYDKKFRYIRDKILNAEEYNFIMDMMIKLSGYDIKKYRKDLWINDKKLIDLYNDGQIIGLHSHTHPTILNTFTYENQLKEYQTNKEVIEGIIPVQVNAVSYPCNSYNDDTDRIMRKLGIQLGFNAKIDNINVSSLHIQREDHANIIRRMKNENNCFYR